MAKKKKGYTLEDLQILANEMNDLMGLDPAIETDSDEETLEELIKVNMDEVFEDDEFTDDSWKILKKMGCAPKTVDEEGGNTSAEESSDDDEEDESAEEGDEAEEAEEGDDDEEDEEDEEEETTLDDLKAMKKKKDLTTFISENDLDTDPAKYKKVDHLRNAIAEELGLIEPEVASEPEPEPEPEPKKGSKKKAESKKAADEKPKKADSKKADKKGKDEKQKKGPSEAVLKRREQAKKRRERLSELISEAEHNVNEIVDTLVEEFPDVKRSTILTELRDSKSSKYCPFDDVSIVDEDGIVKFSKAKGVPKSKAKSGKGKSGTKAKAKDETGKGKGKSTSKKK